MFSFSSVSHQELTESPVPRAVLRVQKSLQKRDSIWEHLIILNAIIIRIVQNFCCPYSNHTQKIGLFYFPSRNCFLFGFGAALGITLAPFGPRMRLGHSAWKAQVPAFRAIFPARELFSLERDRLLWTGSSYWCSHFFLYDLKHQLTLVDKDHGSGCPPAKHLWLQGGGRVLLNSPSSCQLFLGFGWEESDKQIGDTDGSSGFCFFLFLHTDSLFSL